MGTTLTHTVAGPIFKLERYLRGVIAGDEKGEVGLREGDELLELASLINQATASTRDQEARGPAEREEAEVAEVRRAA